MLKKIIIGLLGFVILAAIGLGIYIYTLDWNKHKPLVAERFSQLTGFRSSIDGNLTVELFPSPKLTASKVKFHKASGGKDPLVLVNEITANIDILPLLQNKFIIHSMQLIQASINIVVDEKGNLNWDNVGKNGSNKASNLEASFNDIRLNNSVINYENLATKEKKSFSGISATVSAASLQGPYRITNGKFLHNGSEITFAGDIVKKDTIAAKLKVNNVSSKTQLVLDGTLGAHANGNITFDTQSLFDAEEVIMGGGYVTDAYDSPFYVSFKYDYNDGIAKLENFTTRYGQNTAGTGTVFISNTEKNKEITADFDMTKFDISILVNLAENIINSAKEKNEKQENKLFAYNTSVNIKSTSAVFREAESQNLNLGVNLQNGVLNITRFSLLLPGDTVLKTVGRVNVNEDFDYIFTQVLESKDIKTFASIFDIDLTKLATKENKKSIFKKAEAELKISGGLDGFKILIEKALIDSTEIKGNVGFVKNDKGTSVLADLDCGKISFDHYLEPLPENLQNASIKDKFVYQLNRLPWSHDLFVDANFNINSAVYNKIPIEELHLHFVTHNDSFAVSEFSASRLAGANINLSFEAENVYKEPTFSELSYNVKTDNFPLFVKSLNVPTGQQKLFTRKIFVTQGILKGSFDAFNLSSIQKFGDTEFSYSGSVTSPAKEDTIVDGSLELKTNNVVNFIQSLDFDYTPDMPITTFTFAGKVKGTTKSFALKDIDVYLGANHISGNLQFNNSGQKPALVAELDFDKFDADKWFYLNKKKPEVVEEENQTFIKKWRLKDTKIDYTPLTKLNFDVKATAKQLFANAEKYSDVTTEAMLKDNVLTVKNFLAEQDTNKIDVNFVLDSNGLPQVKGQFNLTNYKLPALGGSVYVLDNGLLDVNGTFNSSALSEKEFINNLNANGKFMLANIILRGWDMDLIKFELEQRKTLKDFEDAILNNLKSGRTNFDRLRGSFSINKGIAVSDNTLWESSVINMNMTLNINLSNWIFAAVFNGVYQNASFSDVLKFTFDGSLANPKVSVDLTESVERIAQIEDQTLNAKKYQEKERIERMSSKVKTMQTHIENALAEIDRMAVDVARFKPVTNNSNVHDIYEDNLKTIRTAETNIRRIQNALKSYPEEEVLLSLETELAGELAKLKFVPKVLEENYIVDSKYVFDETFNKIAWIYNLAQNNSAYYTTLTDVFMGQIEVMKNSETPLPEDKVVELTKGTEKVTEYMDKISSLHSKIRDNYLNIIDTGKISQMKENNVLANQALETMWNYTRQMNDVMLSNLDNFRDALEITSRDYEEYIVYPPEDINEIGTTLATQNKKAIVPTEKKINKDKPVEAEKKADTPKAEKKTQQVSETNINLEINKPANGIAGLFAKFEKQKAPTETQVALGQSFNGLSGLLKSNIVTKTVTDNVPPSNHVEEETSQVADSSVPLNSPLSNNVTSSIGNTQIAAQVEPLEPLGKNGEALIEANPQINTASVEERKETVVKLLNKTREAFVDIVDKLKQAESKILPDTQVTKEQSAIVEAKAEPIVEPKEISVANSQQLLTENDEKKTAEIAVPVAEETIAKVDENQTPAIEPVIATAEINQTPISEDITPIVITDNIQTTPIIPAESESIETPENQIVDEPSITEETSPLKINPVIAMEIGKTATIEANNVPQMNLKEKHGFMVKGTTKPVINDIQDENVEASIEPAQIQVADISIEPEIEKIEENIPNQENIFFQLLAKGKNIMLKSTPKVDVTKDAITHTETLANSLKSKNIYLFQANNKLSYPLSGKIGKSMLVHRVQLDKPIYQPRYLFTDHSLNRTSFSGEIGKQMSLAVK